jgi:cytochrome c553
LDADSVNLDAPHWPVVGDSSQLGLSACGIGASKVRLLKWAGYGLGGVAGLIVIAVLAVFGGSEAVMRRSYDSHAERLATPTPAQLADAGRQGRILGCVSCHGEGLTGRVMVDDPKVGRIVAPNLTVIAARATDQQLATAIRQGIGHDGHPLFVMPSATYARLDDGEVAALIHWIRQHKPKPGQEGGLQPGPLARIGLAAGRLKPQAAKLEQFRVEQPYDLGPAYADGHRIAAKVCADCHGPALGGQRMDSGDVAPDLSIAGAYDFEQFRTLMRTGVAPGGRDLGLMSKVAKDDFTHMTDAELRALHDYLKARAEKLTV